MFYILNGHFVDDSSTQGGKFATSSGQPELDRQQSTSSLTSTMTNDSVFEPESPPHEQRTIAPTNTLSQTSLSGRQGTHATPSSSPPKNNNFITPRKVFNPFPKPTTGLLTAEKAKIGVKLGLYRPHDALAYMSPSERRLFLKNDKAYIGRIAMASQSSMW